MFRHTRKLTKQELHDQVKKNLIQILKLFVTSVPEKLNISKSAYYDYLKRKSCSQKIRRFILVVRIKEIYEELKEIYEALKITKIYC